MKEFYAELGGRKVFNEDIIELQDTSLSITEIFSGLQAFVISGVEVTITAGTIADISAGYLWLGDKIRKFDGQSGVELADNNYIEAEDVDVQTSYDQSVQKVGYKNYTIKWTSQPTSYTPTGDFIKLGTDDGARPGIDEGFFGIRSILKTTTDASQSISSSLVVGGTINATALYEGGVLIANVYSPISHSHSSLSSAAADIFLNQNNTDARIALKIGTQEKLWINENAVNTIRLNSTTIYEGGVSLAEKYGAVIPTLLQNGNTFFETIADGKLNVSGLTDEVYFGHDKPVASGTAAVSKFYFGSSSGVGGKESGIIRCGTIYEAGSSLGAKYLTTSEFKGSEVMGSNTVDFSGKPVKYKTLTANETWNFSNLVEGKVVIVRTTGNFAITFPAICKKYEFSGDYLGTVVNSIQFQCLNATPGSEEIWYSISKSV